MNRRLPTIFARRDEGGFTLPEMLLAIVVGGLVISVLTGAFVVIIRTDTETGKRLTLSHDRQVVENSIVMDIQSAKIVETTTPSGCYSGTGTNVLFLEWPILTGTPATQQVAYAYETVWPVRQLVRQACGPESSSRVVARNLDIAATPLAERGVPTADGSFTVSMKLTDIEGKVYKLAGTPRLSLPNPTPVAGPSTGPDPGPDPDPEPEPAACELTEATVTPATQRQGSGNKLRDAFVVNVKTTGVCGALFVEFSPSADTETVDLIPSGSVLTASIHNNSWSWNTGPHPIKVKSDSDTLLEPTELNQLSVTVTPR